LPQVNQATQVFSLIIAQQLQIELLENLGVLNDGIIITFPAKRVAMSG
jgi:hypothetical protein